ncbi:hypothetical protein OG21DRAFT_527284 [Imleria badia]|nr:hypothetical protein OG21DRAFT_527284 [Imleria badia]
MPKQSFKYTRVASTRHWQTRAFNTITRRRVQSLAMAGQGQRASTRDPEYETRMELAVKDLADGTYRTIKAAAKAHKVARQTLSDRVKGIHKARHQAYKHSQLLNEAQENVVNEWLVQNSGK